MSYGWDNDPDFDDEAPPARGRGRHPLQDPALVQAFLAQGDAWQTGAGEYVAIDDMTPAHALATASVILARARATTLVLLATGDERVTEPIVCQDEASRLLLIDTPLVQALLERGRSASPAELPWASVATAR